MKAVLVALVASVRAGFRSRAALQLEVLALRHQLALYQRHPGRARIKAPDRVLWAWLSRTWAGWRDVLVFVQPSTVIAWQRRRFRDHWARLSRDGEPGRPTLAKAVRDLIRQMSGSNPGWGSPRIVGELAKLGIHVAKATLEKYMVRPKKPPSPTWRAFLNNHVNDLVSLDFFVVPTVMFKVLFVFVVFAHARRQIVHFNITEHPTAQWTTQQISEAFPWETAPRHLIRDRDEVLTARRSPWQNPYAERVIGSIRRECLDNVIVLGEQHLRKLLVDFQHYHRWRCHRSLAMDCPEPRPVQRPEHGDVVEVAEPAASTDTTNAGRPERSLRSDVFSTVRSRLPIADAPSTPEPQLLRVQPLRCRASFTSGLPFPRLVNIAIGFPGRTIWPSDQRPSLARGSGTAPRSSSGSRAARSPASRRSSLPSIGSLP